ncbi:hypothetical protein [Microbispora sp. CA-102843]|uniref:hypothetical protein n=1 Tax=Microbispora sp. CA-102843 TaxID=3239952 RepID=UPI003D9063A8
MRIMPRRNRTSDSERRGRNRKARTEMSRSRTRDPRDTKALAMGLATRRLAMAALVITAAGIAAAQPAIARVTPHHSRGGLTALRNPGPGGGSGQVIKGGRAAGGQGRSGAGRFNQNLTGVISPTFVKGQAQQAITDQGAFEVQSAFCGSQPNSCLLGQNMPVRHGS